MPNDIFDGHLPPGLNNLTASDGGGWIFAPLDGGGGMKRVYTKSSFTSSICLAVSECTRAAKGIIDLPLYINN